MRPIEGFMQGLHKGLEYSGSEKAWHERFAGQMGRAWGRIRALERT